MFYSRFLSGPCLTQGQGHCCDEVDWHRSLGRVWHMDRVSAVMRWTDTGLWAVPDTRTGSVLWWGGLTQVSGPCLTHGQGHCCDEVDWHRSLGRVWHKDRVTAVMRWIDTGLLAMSDTWTGSVLWWGGLTQVSWPCLTQGRGQCCDEVDWHRSLGHVWHKDGVSAVMRWTDTGLWAVSDTRTGSVLWWGGLTQVSWPCLTQGRGQCCDEVDCWLCCGGVVGSSAVSRVRLTKERMASSSRKFFRLYTTPAKPTNQWVLSS